jgi:hypothetical protein
MLLNRIRSLSVFHNNMTRYVPIIDLLFDIYLFIKFNNYIFFLVWHIIPTHCRCRLLLLHLITFSDTFTIGRTPLDEGSACRRNLYLSTHNIYKRQISMTPARAEPRNSSKLTSAVPRLRPLGHWDRLVVTYKGKILTEYDVIFFFLRGRKILAVFCVTQCCV